MANKRLVAGLEDVALEYVSILSVAFRLNLSKLAEALKLCFGYFVLPKTHRAALELAKKEPKENLREYVARVRELDRGQKMETLPHPRDFMGPKWQDRVWSGDIKSGVCKMK